MNSLADRITLALIVIPSLVCLMLASAQSKEADDKPAAIPEPARIVIEAEDMQGVDQAHFGPGPGWQVGRWGEDLYQNMVFGGVWASRQRMAMTDAASPSSGNKLAEVHSDITVPVSGTYKIWAKYEAPPLFNYAFGLRVEALDGAGAVQGRAVFNKVYGLIDSPKHFCFTRKLTRGSLYWNWGIDHDAAEGYEAKLPAGRLRVTLYKADNPEPAGARSVDAILITSDTSELSSPHVPRYPLLDELRRDNHVYFRFRNLSGQPGILSWNHSNHRYPDFYNPDYKDRIRAFDATGALIPAPQAGKNAAAAITANSASPWLDLGPTMNVESTSPFSVRLLPVGARPGDSSLPVAVDIALAPDEKQIARSFQLDAEEPELAFLVQPDLFRKEGVDYSRKTTDIYRDITRELNAEPRLGPLPRKLKFFAETGAPLTSPHNALNFEIGHAFREAIGLNTLDGDLDKQAIEASLEWGRAHGGIIERSARYHHSTDVQKMSALIDKNGVGRYFDYLSYGDEIGLPPVDAANPALLEAFRDFLRHEGENPASMGAAGWEQIKPLPSLSSDVAIKIGILPDGTAPTGAVLGRLKRLYWYSEQFRARRGIEEFAAKTRDFKAALGDDVQASANLGGMHPFFWMNQNAFIESFKRGAMSLAWSEDYTYCQPEGSRLVADFEAAYLRKGASYHDTRMMFYCMPHWPGNTPEHLLQNAVMQWANNVKDLDWFVASPDIWSTENYIAYRGGMPMWKMLRTISGIAGAIEDDLMPARPEKAPVAMLVSQASDLWELQGKTQNDVFPAADGKPASEATNISQEERKNIWYALRLAGYRVDILTENDVKDGLLANYKAVYICGQNIERKNAIAVKEWVSHGGIALATAGAARKDEFDEPLTTLDETLGRGPATAYLRYCGPMRAKIELLFEKPLDRISAGENAFDALASKETFTPSPTAKVLAQYASDKSPAFVKAQIGQGSGYYIGTLPGEAFIKKGLPIVPMGKGGSEMNPSLLEPVEFDESARAVILRPLHDAGILPDVQINHRSVVAGRLSSARSTVLPLINLARQHDGALQNLQVVVTGIQGDVARVWSPFYPKGMPYKRDGSRLTITVPMLQAADVLVISK